MKTSQIVFQIAIIGLLVMIVLKLRKVLINTVAQPAYIPPVQQVQAQNLGFELKPLNQSIPLREGTTGSEVLALQMMLQQYNPTQELTGVMDEMTAFRMEAITEPIYMGDVNLYSFINTFFVPKFGGEKLKEILKTFPNL